MNSKKMCRSALIFSSFALLAQSPSVLADSFGDYSSASKTLNRIQSQLVTNQSVSQQLPKSFDDIGPSLCDADEQLYLQVERSVVKGIKEALSKKDASLISSFLSKNIQISDLRKPKAHTEKSFGNIYTEKRSFNFVKSTNKKATEIFSSLFSDVAKVDFSEVVVDRYFSPRKMRKNGIKFSKLELFMNFDMRYLSKTDKKAQQNGRLKLIVSSDKSNNFSIDSLEFVNIDYITSTGSSFKDLTRQSGLAMNIDTHVRSEAIRRGGYSLAIEDFNKDGIVDMYVGASGNATLLTGDKNFSFNKVDNKALGINDHTLVKSAVFGDFYNTGDSDLLVIRFTPGEENVTNSSDIVLYKNKDGKFKRQANIFDKRFQSRYAMPVAMADYNNDSFLDFYIGFPGAKDFTTLKERVTSNKNYQVQGIYLNNKKDGFVDNSKKSLKDSSFDINIYPHSAISTDYDNDGDMDLIVADDRGNISPLYENLGNGEFIQSNKKLGVINEDYAMGIATGDLNNDGITDIAVTNVNFHATARINNSCEANWNYVNRIPVGQKGLRLFMGKKGGGYTETAKGLNVGEGVAGVEFVDYNNDGLLDIYVANGLWSGNDRENNQDLGSMFVRASSSGIFEDEIKTTGKPMANGRYEDDLYSLKYQSKSQSSIMDILAHYKGDILNSGSKKAKGIRPSLAGFQRNRLYRNMGDGNFVDVAYLEGVDSEADGYILAYTDMNRDGKLDLILRNGDPGSVDAKFPTVEMFKNINTEGKSAVFKLKARYSNKDAVGARIVAEVGNKTIHRGLIGNNGTAQSEKIIHIGMGKSKKIDKITIFWPAGRKTIMKDVKPGFHLIEQGIDSNTISQR